jgi:hypothetical protein
MHSHVELCEIVFTVHSSHAARLDALACAGKSIATDHEGNASSKYVMFVFWAHCCSNIYNFNVGISGTSSPNALHPIFKMGPGAKLCRCANTR